MAPIILMLAIIVLSLISGTGAAYLGFKTYKARRLVALEVERTRDLENAADRQWQEVELDDITLPEQQYHSGQRYGSPAVVVLPADIASVAKPLPLEYTGGEGLVSAPGRVFESTEEDSSKRSERRDGEVDQFQQQDVYAGKPWDFESDGYGNLSTTTTMMTQQQPEIHCPKPMRVITNKAIDEPVAHTAYDAEQTAASAIWDRIDKGEALMPRRSKPEKKAARKLLVSKVSRDSAPFDGNGMQDVDINSTNALEGTQDPASSSVVTKFPVRRPLTDEVDTSNVNVNVQRPTSYTKRKASVDRNVAAAPPTQEVDRAAEARRKMADAKKQRAERQRQEEEQVREEERRRVQKQEEREEEERLLEIEAAQQLELDPPSKPRRHKSSTSTSSSTRKRSLSTPLTTTTTTQEDPSSPAIPRLSKRADTSPLPPSLALNPARSASMTETRRPDFSARMGTIVEGVRASSLGQFGKMGAKEGEGDGDVEGDSDSEREGKRITVTGSRRRDHSRSYSSGTTSNSSDPFKDGGGYAGKTRRRGSSSRSSNASASTNSSVPSRHGEEEHPERRPSVAAKTVHEVACETESEGESGSGSENDGESDDDTHSDSEHSVDDEVELRGGSGSQTAGETVESGSESDGHSGDEYEGHEEYEEHEHAEHECDEDEQHESEHRHGHSSDYSASDSDCSSE